MDREQFIELLKNNNYTDDEIKEMLEEIDEARNDGLNVKYEDIVIFKSEI